MHLLLTGISGFLGRHVADLAVRNGHTVTAVVRVGDKRKYERVTVIERDLTSPASLSSEFKGVDAVIHCAADTNMSSRRIEAAWTFNIRSTENLVRESKLAGIGKFIHVSTANTMTGDESGTLSSSPLPYIATKIENERMLLREFHDNNFPAVIVNPSFILGPGDGRSGSTRLIKALAKNRILVHTGGGKSVVDVRDVAAAILNAMTMGKAGQRYVLAGESISYRRMIDMIDVSLKRTSVKIKLPDAFWRLIGYSGTAVSFLRHRGSTINHLTMNFAVGLPRYSSALAKADLDFRPRPVDETIIDTVTWLTKKQ